jgi:hypothetical protein
MKAMESGSPYSLDRLSAWTAWPTEGNIHSGDANVPRQVT